MIAPLRRLLLAIVFACLGVIPAAQAATTAVQTGDCDITITVNLEIFGDLATQAHADKMKQRSEALWNGPSGQTAEILGSNVGIAPAAFRGSQGSETLNWQRDKIDDEYNEYLEEFGLSENNCAYLPCCRIHFRTNVIIRSKDAAPTEGHHQIEIMPDTKQVDDNGTMKTVRNRSFVYKVKDPGSNPATYHMAKPGESTEGEWRVGGGDNPPEAHEIGHLMGLGDTYIETGGSQPGHSHDLMSSNTAFPFEDALSSMIDFFGMKCDCCPKESADSFWSDFAQATLALGDAIAACNRGQLQGVLDDLNRQRKEIPLVDMPVTDLVELASSIDERIEAAKKALEDCPPERPVTGGIPDDYGLLPGFSPTFTWATDSTKWCTYGSGIPGEETPTDGDDPRDAPPPEEDDGDDPSDAPPPEDGDDPRDAPPPDDGDDPRDTSPPPPEEDDGDDPRDVPGIDLPGPEDDDDDGDDPRDTSLPPPEEDDDDDDPRDVPVFVKAKAAVLDGSSTDAKSQEAVAGQTIKLFDPVVADMALPNESGAKNDAAFDQEPMQCTTDDNGDCVIDVPACDYDDPSKCALGLTASQLSADGYALEIEVAPTEGKIVKLISDAAAKEFEGDVEEIEGISLSGYKMKLDLGYTSYVGYGQSYDTINDWSLSLGTKFKMGDDFDVQIDYCRDKQPGPPLGWEPADYDEGDAIPSAIVAFDAEVRP